MSIKGIKLFARVLESAQETRGKLLDMGSRAYPIDKIDIRLGQMLDEMKDAVKEEFERLTLEED